jgi:peroxin-6
LLEGPRRVGKYTVASEVARSLGMHLLEVSGQDYLNFGSDESQLNCYEMIGEAEMKANTILGSFEQASSCAPCMLILRRLEAFQNVTEDAGTGMCWFVDLRWHSPSPELGWSAILEQCFEKMLQNWTILGQSVVIVGTTSEARKVPLSIRSQFKYRISCKVSASTFLGA